MTRTRNISLFALMALLLAGLLAGCAGFSTAQRVDVFPRGEKAPARESMCFVKLEIPPPADLELDYELIGEIAISGGGELKWDTFRTVRDEVCRLGGDLVVPVEEGTANPIPQIESEEETFEGGVRYAVYRKRTLDCDGLVCRLSLRPDF